MSKKTEALSPDVETQEDTIYVTSKGVKVELIKIPPFKLMLVQDVVKIPKPPKYEISTATGKVESYYMDEQVAEEIEHGTKKWQMYLEERAEAETALNRKAMEMLLSWGTRILDWGTVQPDWVDDYTSIGMDVPEDEKGRARFYLTHELDAEDLTAIQNRILQMSGVQEKEIQEAEDSFRGEVPTRSE